MFCACRDAFLFMSDFLSYYILPHQPYQQGVSTHSSFLCVLFVTPLCVNSRERCDFPGGQQFLKYLNHSIWYQHAYLKESQRSHVLIFKVNSSKILACTCMIFLCSVLLPLDWLIRKRHECAGVLKKLVDEQYFIFF